MSKHIKITLFNADLFLSKIWYKSMLMKGLINKKNTVLLDKIIHKTLFYVIHLALNKLFLEIGFLVVVTAPQAISLLMPQ